MIQQLLYAVIFAETALILLLLFKTPQRKLIILTLDIIKRGRVPFVVKFTCSILFFVLLSHVSCFLCILFEDDVVPNPTLQVLASKHLLEGSLMGFVLFLSVMVDRVHHYIRELVLLRKSADRFLVECFRLLEDNQNLRNQLEGKISM